MSDKIALCHVRNLQRRMKSHRYLSAPPSKVSDQTMQLHAQKSCPADVSEKTVVPLLPAGEVPVKGLGVCPPNGACTVSVV